MKTSECKNCNCLYFSANAFARKVEKLASETWKKVGLAPSHATLLGVVLNEPGLQAGQLANQMQLTPSTITRLLEKMEEKKLVIRNTDGKMTNVYPTQKAKDLKPLMKQCMDEFNEKYTKILGKEESKHFIQSMNIMADKLGS